MKAMDFAECTAPSFEIRPPFAVVLKLKLGAAESPGATSSPLPSSFWSLVGWGAGPGLEPRAPQVVLVKNLSVRGCLFPRLTLSGKGPWGGGQLGWLCEAPWSPLITAPLLQVCLSIAASPAAFKTQPTCRKSVLAPSIPGTDSLTRPGPRLGFSNLAGTAAQTL